MFLFNQNQFELVFISSLSYSCSSLKTLHLQLAGCLSHGLILGAGQIESDLITHISVGLDGEIIRLVASGGHIPLVLLTDSQQFCFTAEFPLVQGLAGTNQAQPVDQTPGAIREANEVAALSDYLTVLELLAVIVSTLRVSELDVCFLLLLIDADHERSVQNGDACSLSHHELRVALIRLADQVGDSFRISTGGDPVAELVRMDTGI